MIENKIQWIKDRPHLCVAPFNTYDYRILDGKLKITVCCNLDTKYTDQELDNDFIKSLQTDIENKKLPAACHLCGTSEETGAQSERIKYLIDIHADHLIKFEQDKKTLDAQVGMKFSNKCNLACRSCNQYDSSLWAEKMSSPLTYDERSFQHDISENSRYWQQMTAMIIDKHSQTDNFSIHPIGGETMVQSGFQKLLNWLIDENLAATTRILLTTSLAVNLEEWRETFLKFKQVALLSSIDSVHENYHYVRWPAKFSRIQRNLEEILKVEKLFPGKYRLYITPVFSLNNIFYITDFLDFWFDWSTKNKIHVTLQTTHINRPRPLMIESLRSEYIGQLIPIIESAITHPFFKQTNQPETQVQLEYFKSMLSILKNTTDVSDKFFTDYLKFTADYDKRTETSSRMLNNRLFDLLSPQDLEIYDNYYKVVDVSRPVYNINYDIENFDHSTNQ